MERERQKKSWRDRDRTRDRSSTERDRPGEAVASGSTLAKQYRSALEALFAPKVEEAPEPTPLPKTAARIVLPPSPNADPRTAERRRLLAKVLGASAPGPITKAANDFLAAGFEFPEDQEVHVQLLEHADEAQVRGAIAALGKLLAGQLPKRKPLLDQRLRRIEEQAEEIATREAASALRRVIHGRGGAPSSTQR